MKLFFTAAFFAATVMMSAIAQPDSGQSPGKGVTGVKFMTWGRISF